MTEKKALWIGEFWGNSGFVYRQERVAHPVDKIVADWSTDVVRVMVSLDEDIEQAVAEKIILDKYAQWKREQKA